MNPIDKNNGRPLDEADAEPSNTRRAILRSMVRGVYDLQKLRIESGNRLVATFKAKLGHEPGTREADTIDEEGQSVLEELKAHFKLLTNFEVRSGNTWRLVALNEKNERIAPFGDPIPNSRP